MAMLLEESSPRVRLGLNRPRLLLVTAVQLTVANRLKDAEDLLRLLLDLEPSNALALSTLASVRERAGDLDGSLALFEQAVDAAPGDPTILSNSIFALDRHPSTTLAQAYAVRRRYNDLVTRAPMAHANDRDPERKLQLGYVSADYRNHSAATGFAPVVVSHDREQFEVHLYSSTPEHDWLTDILRQGTDHWHDVTRLSDADLATKIQADQIDILVDLSGHTPGTRLPTFAMKPAPVQVSAWGYPTGTGLTAMDYLFADDVCVRPDEEQWYAEQIVRLPRIMPYWAADPSGVGEVQPSPCERNGYLTFGVFQRLGKLHPACLTLWARVLDAIPDARLIIKSSGLELQQVDDQLRARLTAAGADNERIQFYGGSNKDDHLMAYGDVDVCLDPWPDGGGVSTCEAAWMGVPTLTSPWHQIPSRFTSSLNVELGLDGFIVTSPSAFIARAVEIDQQRDALVEIRRWMRDWMRASAFCSHSAFTRVVERRYREMWRTYLDTRETTESQPILRLVESEGDPS